MTRQVVVRVDGCSGRWTIKASVIATIRKVLALAAIAWAMHLAPERGIGVAQAAITPTGELVPAYTDQDPWIILSQLIVADQVDGSLTIDNGSSVESAGGYLGYNTTANGTATVTGTDSFWDSGNLLHVGHYGNGTLTISDGGEVASVDSYVGFGFDAVSAAHVTGAGSLWNTPHVYIGGYGTGTLDIQNGGTVDSNMAKIGNESGSSGAVTVSGSQSLLNCGSTLHVAVYGNGVLNIEDGATVQDAGGYIAYGAGAIGEATVTGTGSVWEHDHGLRVGNEGIGTLNILNGGTVTNLDGGAHLGFEANASGTATVQGVGSVWNMDDGLAVGYYGSGDLTIENGGQVNSSGGTIGVYDDSWGTATVTGAGSVWNGSVTVGYDGTGTLVIENGGVVNSYSSYVGIDSGSTGTATVTGPGSAWNGIGQRIIGSRGTATLLIEHGGSASNSDASIGLFSTSNGTVTVTGADSVWTNTGDLRIGPYGTGTLNIENGGVVHVAGDTWIGSRPVPGGETSLSIPDGDGSINLNQTVLNTSGLVASPSELLGTGTINTATIISDVDVRFDAVNGLLSQIVLNSLPGQNVTINIDASAPVNPGSLGAGYRGTGSLTIADGLSVSSAQGYIGYHAGSTGTVTATGPDSAWVNAGEIIIGEYGTGTLNIQNGATVSNTDSFIADETDSNGTVTITGTGSAWNNSADIRIGNHGTGTLNIENGGSVDNYYSYVGYWYESNAAVTVTSPGSTWNSTGVGSQWGDTGALNIGMFGTGALNIENGGSVNSTSAVIGIGSTAYFTSTGTVNVSGAGSVWNNTGELTIGQHAVGTLNIENGGTVNVMKDTWTGRISTGHGTINLNQGTLNTAGLLASPSELSGAGTIHTAGLVSDVDLVFDAISGPQSQVVLNSLPGQNITINVNPTNPAHIGTMGAGYRGTGTLTIADGMTVSSVKGILGYWPGSDGTATITGAGSAWNLAGGINVGVSGTGVLNIENSGAVSVGGDVILAIDPGSVGVINLSGGILDLNGYTLFAANIPGEFDSINQSPANAGHGVNPGASTAVFNFTGGTLQNAESVALGGPLLQQGGTIAPGGVNRLTHIAYGYELASGTIEIELGGDGGTHDRLISTDNIDIALAGTTLDLPALGSIATGTYTVIESTGGTVNGMFENITGIGIYAGLVDVLYTSNAVTITLNWDFVPGDLNGDGFVGIGDLNVVLGVWNTNVTPGDLLAGDPSGDGFVGIADLNVVLGNWNAGTPPGEASTTVPEPSSAAAVLVLSLLGFSRRRG